MIRYDLNPVFPHWKEKPTLKSYTRVLTRSLFVAGACALALASSACGGEPGSADSSPTEAIGQELSTCTAAALPVALATASTQQAASFAPKYAVDGITTTRWSSGPAADQWLKLDMGQVVNVSGLIINWQTAYSKAFTVESSADGLTNWSAFITSGATAAGVQSLSGVAATRYLRIHSTLATSWGNVSIVDVSVLGTADPACGNLLKSSWSYLSDDFDPPSFDASTTYSVSGNSIAFTYSGKSFIISGTGLTGIRFTQPAAVVLGGQYRLRLDISKQSGASTTVWWASLSGAASPADYVTGDSTKPAIIDFTVSSAPGATPVIQLENKPITVFPGAGVQDFTVTATLTKTN